ncbi:MAG: hypothetical protein IPI21_02775 [Propionivibrio sp.]|nr:hypothetical protein [Propionivibrio sp.]
MRKQAFRRLMNLAGAALDILDQRAESSGHLVQAVADKFEFVTGAKSTDTLRSPVAIVRAFAARRLMLPIVA